LGPASEVGFERGECLVAGCVRAVEAQPVGGLGEVHPATRTRVRSCGTRRGALLGEAVLAEPSRLTGHDSDAMPTRARCSPRLVGAPLTPGCLACGAASLPAAWTEPGLADEPGIAAGALTDPIRIEGVEERGE
jgi:hypothetical protein